MLFRLNVRRGVTNPKRSVREEIDLHEAVKEILHQLFTSIPILPFVALMCNVGLGVVLFQFTACLKPVDRGSFVCEVRPP